MIRSIKTYHARKVIAIPIWEKADTLKDFIYPWSPEIKAGMTFRALWNDRRFYFRFDITGSRILTFTRTNHKMEVVDSDRIEIFLRANNQLNPYYCLEIDPLGRILDYKAKFYRQFDYEWQWPGEKELEVRSAFTAAGYFVEGSISLGSLKELGLLRDQALETGLFRGECLKLPEPESSFNWISWVKPESRHPDFHLPSAFGRIELVTGDW
jgi:hypothetical protein